MWEKIREKRIEIAIIGLGYVGLPLAVEFAKAGFSVIGIDLDEYKVKRINNGSSYITDVSNSSLAYVVNSGRLRATRDYGELIRADIIDIAVPTPLSKSKTPDVRYIVMAMEGVKQYFRKDKAQLIILESTTYPGTTRELVVNELVACGYELDRDFYAAFSPERVDPGNSRYRTENTPKVVGGASELSTKLAVALYSQVIHKVVAVKNCEEAEMCKLLENTFRAINIGFVNELAMMCDKMGINIWNVISAAKTKPFGFMPFYPGPGIGGHCIPLDPIYLSWKAKHYGFFNRSIELASDINENMPDFAIDKLLRIMNERKKLLNVSKVVMLGVAYKPDVNDCRESPALTMYEKLKELGALVEYYDPYVPFFYDKKGRTVRGIRVLNQETLNKSDIVVLITSHKVFDYQFIYDNASLIFDTRNAFRDYADNKV
ncbi:MAG: nucleotide sugar dehydrogenase, partial [Phycisphaerales bacterium]